MIGTAKNPRCFRNSDPPVKYFNQAKAWSDSKTFTLTFTLWYTEVFLPFVRRFTSRKVLLIMDNCSSHTSLEDPKGQVTVVELPPNCTSKHQPMDQGIIAAFKTRYRTRLLGLKADTMTSASQLRQAAAARKMRAGTKGLAEGHDPHVLDAAELAFEAWEGLDSESVARCWAKADVLPTLMQDALKNDCGRGVRHGAEDTAVNDLSAALLSISLKAAQPCDHALAGPEADLVEALQSLGVTAGQAPLMPAITAALEWVRLEEREDISTALREDLAEELSEEFHDATPQEVSISDGEEEDATDDVAAAHGSLAATQAVPPLGGRAPPPYSTLAPAFEVLEAAAAEHNVEEVTALLRKAKLAWMAAAAGRARQQSNITDYFFAVEEL
jgi:hypothetical protein